MIRKKHKASMGMISMDKIWPPYPDISAWQTSPQLFLRGQQGGDEQGTVVPCQCHLKLVQQVHYV